MKPAKVLDDLRQLRDTAQPVKRVRLERLAAAIDLLEQLADDYRAPADTLTLPLFPDTDLI